MPNKFLELHVSEIFSLTGIDNCHTVTRFIVLFSIKVSKDNAKNLIVTPLIKCFFMFSH